ncbi:MAG TPA: hypothetical protein VJX67_09555 [Blastocatellia bacterium]|nr:hypothetical protein [Blastocatellia bacterium]
MRKSSDKKGRTRNAVADGRQVPSGKHPRRTRRFKRDQGLLVRDEDIHDFVGRLSLHQLSEVAGRFDEIACVIFEDLHTDLAGEATSKGPSGSPRAPGRASGSEGDSAAGSMGATEAGQTLPQRIAERVPQKAPKIRRIGRESRAHDYRKIVAAIEEAVRSGDGFSARRTAEAVVEEAFRYTPFYSRAMEEFCVSLRAMRRGVRG